MTKFEKPYKMTCDEAQLLMIPMWAKMPGIANKEKMAFNTHLIICSTCSKEYEETKKLMSLVKAHWGAVSTETRQLLEKASYEVLKQKHISTNHKPTTTEKGWKDLCWRCPDLAEGTKKPKSLQLFMRIGAIAACLVIGVLTWMVFSNYSKPHNLAQAPSGSRQVTTAPKPSVKVELIKSSGNIEIDASQTIIADNGLKTLLINGKHQMVLNAGTVLTIEPTMKQTNIGCLVKLDSGQIYTHVQHDGNPFIVDTANGQALITGTTFDIKATKDSTTLVVTEGTVRFESEKGFVNVAAGQKSMLAANSKPTLPALCDVKMLTVWATSDKDIPDLAVAKLSSSKESDYEWPWPIESKPIALEDVDYEHWLKEKQNWFMSEFPWIFQLQKALAKEGVEVGYHELLIQSGDLWQFSYLQDQPSRFSILSFDSLQKAASYYGFDRRWLPGNVTAAKYALVNSALPDETIDLLNAFKQWNNIFKTSQQTSNTVDYDILEHLFRASIYTANTRNLLWFAVKTGNYSLTDKERSEALTLLQQQVNAATMCQENALYQPSKEKQLCDTALWPQDKWYQWTIAITKNIEEIIHTEEKITRYEICK